MAACPGCGVASARVHSRYVRRLADSAVGHRGVVIELGVRRFRCQDSACTRATFVEQIDGLTFRYGRRSAGLQRVLQRLALMLAGRAGPGRRPACGNTRGHREPVHTAAPHTGLARSGGGHAKSTRGR
ncbi:transposase family protein [Streptomyces mirabilis]|uniref:transposase family protein n=1 Tax=Streptomyces mirabilis TaxID=68239 RepID=UPI0033C89101